MPPTTVKPPRSGHLPRPNMIYTKKNKWKMSGSQNIIQLICFLYEKQIVTVRDYLHTASGQKYSNTTKLTRTKCDIH